MDYLFAQFIVFWLVVLSAWRITSLLVREDGPFDVFARLRLALGVYYDDMSEAHGRNTVAKALTCTWCLSVWISLFAALLSPFSVNILSYWLNVFAISTLIIWIDKQVI